MSPTTPNPHTADGIEELIRRAAGRPADLDSDEDAPSVTLAQYVSPQLREVQMERDAQDRMFPEQTLPFGTSLENKVEADVARKECDDATSEGSLTWVHVLTEEYWEAMAETDPDKLRMELLQLAAVAVRIVEQIDSGDVPAHDCG